MRTATLVALVLGCSSRAVPPDPATPMAPAVEAVVTEGSVKPGINKGFLDPELDVDEWTERFGAESREVVARQPDILAAMALQSGETVADVGAGTGLYLAPFAEAVGAEGTVYAVDISPVFLDNLQVMAREGGYGQVETVLADERSSNLPPGSVDVVFICDTYHHFEYPTPTMESLYAALEPGGRLFVVDFVREEGVTRPWTLEHVRAGQEVFAAEIRAVGFSEPELVEVGLQENYLLRFTKPQ